MSYTKRKATSELVSPPPAVKRVRSEAPTSTPRATSQSSSAPRRSSDTPLRRPSRLSPAPSGSSWLVQEDPDEETDPLLWRIQTGIEYVREQQRRGEAIGQTTRFEIATGSTSPALDLLRHHATPISTSSLFEIFELGVPRPNWVKQGILPGLHDPQWWVGKTAAETKAGPHADEYDVKRAAAHLKGLQTKKNKKKVLTVREKEIEWKLKEGMRRQKAGLKMWDGEEDENESEEDSETDGSKEESEDEVVAGRPRVRGRRWMLVIEEESESESEREDNVPL